MTNVPGNGPKKTGLPKNGPAKPPGSTAQRNAIPPRAAKPDGDKKVSLALQGGGAHGAYAWGVMDYLLEDGRVAIPAVTATSAGAMNAVAYAYGFMRGGREGARETLHNFWDAVARKGALFSPFAQNRWMQMTPFSPFAFFSAMANYASPYDLNPFDFNPLRDILDEMIDFGELNRCKTIKLFISATSVATGKAKVFDRTTVTREAVLASACLPQMFQAVEIEGESYWDGGYVSNPALFPLFYEDTPRDVLIVHLNPITRHDTPRSAADIANRLNEITFNAALIAELRAIAFVQRLLDENWLTRTIRSRYRRILVHAIRADRTLADLSVESKFDTSWEFLTDLRDRGREAAAQFLEAHFSDLGRKSTVDVREEFLEPALNR